MRRTLGTRVGLLIAVVSAALILAVGALANNGILGASIVVSAPGTVAYGSDYTITVSGKTGTVYAQHVANQTNKVVAFEGGSKTGAPLPCYTSYSTEFHMFAKLQQTRQYTVLGPFTVRFSFVANHKGRKGFCAYLLTNHPLGPNEFAFAQTTWTVS
jgi:hypothetical protein